MKINFRILCKAVWETLKFPLLSIGVAVVTFTTIRLVLHYLGLMTFPVIIGTLLIGLVTMFVVFKYKDLMYEHRKEQQKIVDTLRR